MAGKRVEYEFWRMEKKKVPNGFVKDKDGKDTNQKKYEEVDVQITYSSGTLHITQTPGHNSVDTAGTEFDLSAGTYVFTCILTAICLLVSSVDRVSVFLPAGFRVGITYHDGQGKTDRYEGWESTSESCTIGHDAIGLTDSFVRGTHGCYQRMGLVHKPGIDDLMGENARLWEPEHVKELEAMHQRYRDGQSRKRAERERILTGKFWPAVYNNADLNARILGEWMKANASEDFQKCILSQNTALKYLWGRHTFVSRRPQNLYWFCFFDDLWSLNYKMSMLKDKAHVFGTSKPNCLAYNPMPRPELENLLKGMGLIGSKNSKPHYFFPEMLDKLYGEMMRANDAAEFTPAVKRGMLFLFCIYLMACCKLLPGFHSQFSMSTQSYFLLTATNTTRQVCCRPHGMTLQALATRSTLQDEAENL